MFKSASCFTVFAIFVAVSLSSSPSVTRTEAYGGVNPNNTGNVTVKWDVMGWAPDGYVAVVTIKNYQRNRRIQAPGWRLGWTWAKKEVIWSIVGGQVTRQGDCSGFRGNIPNSCLRTPTIVDLKPNAPYTQRIYDCCRGGVLNPWVHGRPHSTSAFQITVGRAGTTNRTVTLPRNVMFSAPGDVYTCGPAKIVTPTRFLSVDKRRVIQAIMTWNVTCLYSGAERAT